MKDEEAKEKEFSQKPQSMMWRVKDVGYNCYLYVSLYVPFKLLTFSYLKVPHCRNNKEAQTR